MGQWLSSLPTPRGTIPLRKRCCTLSRQSPGVTSGIREEQLKSLKKLQSIQHADIDDPEILTKISNYEMAYRMQTSVPEVMDVSNEPHYIFDLYGEDSKNPGSFAANCLLARKLAEKDVKFIQLYHRGWDQHGNLPNDIKKQAKETDQATAAFNSRPQTKRTVGRHLGHLGRRIWANQLFSRDAQTRQLRSRSPPHCFTIFMAGAGVKKGITIGATDDFGYNIAERPVHIHDFQATLMHLLGIDHEKLTFKFQGRRYRLTDVHGKVVNEVLA